MVFSSPLFLYGFAPLFFAVYYLSPSSIRNYVILAGSVVFYAVGAGSVVAILLLSAWFNHFLGLRLGDPRRGRRTLLLGAGIAVNLAGLVYYKYTGFLWRSANDALANLGVAPFGPAPVIALPIGISFFTFQAVSYLVDIYRGDIPPARSYGEFAAYHTLFPQLIAGPIVRYREIAGELASRRIDLAGLTEGAYRFCLGLGKKLILADNLGSVTDQIMALPAGELTLGHAWLGIACYTLQIYYDFAGYSDMAIGLGRLLGFSFPENFDQPYRAATVTEFWRHWHMTLTRWFRDYLYIPLGGNRRGALRTYLNLWMVFCLCGLWHGAAVTFLIWGVYHGCLLMLERMLHLQGWRAPRIVGTPVTLILVMIGWVFFRSDSLDAAVAYLRAMLGAGQATVVYLPLRYFLRPDIDCYLAAGIALALVPTGRLRGLRRDRTPLMAAQLAAALTIFAYSAALLAANSFNPFIYFRF
jgi:alginate O-acetyltransferase complex protein AlgI